MKKIVKRVYLLVANVMVYKNGKVETIGSVSVEKTSKDNEKMSKKLRREAEKSYKGNNWFLGDVEEQCDEYVMDVETFKEHATVTRRADVSELEVEDTV